MRSTPLKSIAALSALITLVSCQDNPPQETSQTDSTVSNTGSMAADSTPTAASAEQDCPPNPTANDRTICTDRIGPILRATSRAQLRELFAGALVDTAVHVGEGEYRPGTILNRGQADSITVIWSDTSRTRITGFSGLGNAWHTAGGLRVGSSLAEMEKSLGPFDVLGFGWDYGGTVMLTNTPLENSGIFFRTEPRISDAARQTPAYQRVRGDRPYASTSADVRALDLVVRAIDVRWQ